MYDSKTRTPRLYKEAAKIAKDVSEGKGSIKNLVFEAKHPNTNALRALVSNTFLRMKDIENLLKKSKLLIKEPKFDPWLAKILITELLWGKKRLQKVENKKIATILAYEQIFKAHLSDTSFPEDDIVQVEKPRYVRVNTLKISVNEAIEGFTDEGWVLKTYSDVNNYSGFLDAVANLGPNEFMVDLHIPYLLIFPPKTKFYDHPTYKNGYVMLQDKASCFSVHFLNPEPGATVLDMCASPGMKTTQLASIMEDKGTIYAVEIGTKRYQTLNKIVEVSGATCIKTLNKDTLTLTEKDLPDVEYILVDPSCSGSGITDRVEIGQQNRDRDPDRLGKLANLQIMILKHALIRYSKAKRVVYSTCSMFPEENEDVVRRVLETCTNFKLVPAGPRINDVWLHYGSSEFGDIGNYCLYAKPDVDLTTGFFVAVFERLQPGETNPFSKILPKKKPKRYQEFTYSDYGDYGEGQVEMYNDDFVESKIKIEEAELDDKHLLETENDKPKKKKKHVENAEETAVENESVKEKKKKKKKADTEEISTEIKTEKDVDETLNVQDEQLTEKRKKSKNKSNREHEENILTVDNIKSEHEEKTVKEEPTVPKKKKKKSDKEKEEDNSEIVAINYETDSNEEPKKRKKKKKDKVKNEDSE